MGGLRPIDAATLTITCILSLGQSAWVFAQVEAGRHIPAAIDTPIDYAGVAEPGTRESRWFHVLNHPGATYLAIHFSDFSLAPGDCVMICDQQGGQQDILVGKGKMQAGTFWARHVKGDTVLLELIVTSDEGGAGFAIDEYVAGDINLGEPGIESVQGPDDRGHAVCYQQSHPEMYDRGRAVIRLLINGSTLCTGSLVSPYDHVMTNDHCIYSQSRAVNTDFELMAEAPACDSDNCGLCWPGVVFSGGTLLQHDGALDYALILLNDSGPAQTYGHLDLDNRRPLVGEQIYIPQHAGGQAREFAIFSSHPSDTGGVARIQSITEPPCQGGTHQEVGYFADTEPGASGSPVLAASSHRMIALHHCGGSPNVGVPMDLIYPRVRNDVLGLRLADRIAPGAIAVSADSSQSGQGPDQAIDADVGTSWVSGASGSPHRLQLDLGLLATVRGFKVWHASAGGGNVSQNTRAFLIESALSAAGPWTTEFVGDNSTQQQMNEFEYFSPRELRHVRLAITDPGTDGIARAAEFEVLSEPCMTEGTPEGPNVAPQSSQAQASSVYGAAWGPEKAIDGVISAESKWTSADQNPPHTLTLDLGSLRCVSGFVLRQPSAAGEPSFLNLTDFSFQSARSMAGPWFTESRIFTSGAAAFEARTFVRPKDLRYVRLLVEDPGDDRIARVPEFEVLTHVGAVALFDGSPTVGHSPLTVDFMDQSLGSITSWSWSFGDGDTSVVPSPSHTYDRPGIYTVSLSVSGPDGSDSMTRVDYIHVQSVQADFDQDGDVDQQDFGRFQVCLSGPGMAQNDPDCSRARLDGDVDVDVDDLQVFLGCMSGPDLSVNPDCAN